MGKKQNQKLCTLFTLLIFEGPYYAISTRLGQSIFHSWPLINIHTDLLHFTDKQFHTQPKTAMHICSSQHDMQVTQQSTKETDCPQTVFKNTNKS